MNGKTAKKLRKLAAKQVGRNGIILKKRYDELKETLFAHRHGINTEKLPTKKTTHMTDEAKKIYEQVYELLFVNTGNLDGEDWEELLNDVKDEIDSQLNAKSLDDDEEGEEES